MPTPIPLLATASVSAKVRKRASRSECSAQPESKRRRSSVLRRHEAEIVSREMAGYSPELRDLLLTHPVCRDRSTGDADASKLSRWSTSDDGTGPADESKDEPRLSRCSIEFPPGLPTAVRTAHANECREKDGKEDAQGDVPEPNETAGDAAEASQSRPRSPGAGTVVDVLEVGSRCSVLVSPGRSRRVGTVAFVGQGNTSNGPEVWIGVHLDNPDGTCDGSVGGRRYFSCPPRHGAFTLAANVRPLCVARGAGGSPRQSSVCSRSQPSPTAASAQTKASRRRSEPRNESTFASWCDALSFTSASVRHTSRNRARRQRPRAGRSGGETGTWIAGQMDGRSVLFNVATGVTKPLPPTSPTKVDRKAKQKTIEKRISLPGVLRGRRPMTVSVDTMDGMFLGQALSIHQRAFKRTHTPVFSIRGK